ATRGRASRFSPSPAWAASRRTVPSPSTPARSGASRRCRAPPRCPCKPLARSRMAERCDILLTNAHVLTMDERFTTYRTGAVAIQGNVIVAVGAIDAEFTAAETVDCRGRVVMPGLVNAHTHAPMTLLRGLADDLRLDVWLMGYMMPVERAFVSPDFVRLGTRLACAEMIRSGVTCFADMYYFEDAIAEATAAAGMRALCAQTVLRFPTPAAPRYEESLARAADFIRKWRGHPPIVPAPAPHAPLPCTPGSLRRRA